MSTTLTDRINALLPQTQCTKCGYDGCRPYAHAIATSGEAINRCPPGGQDGIQALAELLGRPALELDLECGKHKPLQRAVIDEAHCIGCTLCIQACPVDAIVGANKFMHTVLADQCTGCDLCVDPCPVDCISMIPAGHAWSVQLASSAKLRYEQRQHRLNATHPETLAAAARTLANKAAVSSMASDAALKQKTISDAVARARARRHNAAT
ncbi:electron transport complex subunit RsxB [Eoetvoesiella caeni]|uniref:Electron transport complex protein RnfB n=1 Tax=Eoetvoesiella caeni TaxID=645616 RepID=A0A366HKM6_9BURK|nr:electron transport complex subunit RsxB [Eoetvoesiella caeni]MCI2807106.1 electron transport complex subunit RsxB [Eoetvoesiella caeni]NYT53497.1 electron transport complex subunit RsxB [Eoetvoesiella caeni]RBP43483.1 electron transport complex protein RnfB [Eoetvoesiella caeni]